jgi:Uncharacterized protein conserved in bacteria (DUF2169)
MAERTPATDRYDALVDFEESLETAPRFAFGLVKFTFDLTPEGCVPAAPEALFHDLRDPTLEPRLCPGTDFWPTKLATDVVVTGSAFHLEGAEAPFRLVTLQVGRTYKQVAVYGGRRVTMGAGGVPVFSEPEPFAEMPVINANAYGGWDARVPMPFSDDLKDVMMRQYEHPGIYPRNPFGKGYVVVPELPENELELPNLEDPHDLLTPERFFVRDPRLWYRQPLPWCLDWSSAVMFHRYVWLGTDAWFAAPADTELPEVVRRMLPPGYRQMAASLLDQLGAPPGFVQEASLGMAFAGLEPGTPVAISGMSPEYPTLRLALPAPPRIAFSLGEEWQQVNPRLHSVLVLPRMKKMHLVYGASYGPLTRKYVPGIHALIPLAMRVEDDPPIRYETPISMGEVHRASR